MEMSSSESTRSNVGVFIGIGVVVTALALIIVNPFGSSSDSDDAATGDHVLVGQFEFDTVDDGVTDLSDFDGQPLVVNYFAAWCPPCRAEIPAFNNVAADYDGDVAFIGISRDADHDAWRSFVDETGLTYTSVFEGQGQGSFEALDGIGMPTTLLIDADGSIAENHAGALTESALRDLIEEHFSG